jgi:hypothetical protein
MFIFGRRKITWISSGSRPDEKNLFIGRPTYLVQMQHDYPHRTLRLAFDYSAKCRRTRAIDLRLTITWISSGLRGYITLRTSVRGRKTTSMSAGDKLRVSTVYVTPFIAKSEGRELPMAIRYAAMIARG